jgi:hypothetical protein
MTRDEINRRMQEYRQQALQHFPLELVGWVERFRETHQPRVPVVMGFAKGSTHPTAAASIRHRRSAE